MAPYKSDLFSTLQDSREISHYSPWNFNPAAVMGRAGNYKSPSTIKRNIRRLLIHLHKMLKVLKLNDHSGPTSVNLENVSLFTSTPKRQAIACEECKERCHENHHLEIHRRAHTRELPDISLIELPD